MINGGVLFIGFIAIWVVFGAAKDYERQARIKEEEEEQQEDSAQTKNKKAGKRNV